MNKNLSSSLNKTLVESDLTNITIDLIENFLDEKFLEDSILKEIPIISTIIGFNKTINSVKDYLFGKKILNFLNGLSEISIEKRNKAISKINISSDYAQSVGSKLLYIIDSAQDHVTSKIISKLFVAFINEELSYQEFCKASLIINKIDFYDLDQFLNMPDEVYGYNRIGMSKSEEIDIYLINSGLCYTEMDPVTVEDQDDWKSNEKYIVRGGESLVYRTIIGTKIYKILAK
ncbi:MULTISPECIES: hypothetical protein [unclassified Empedobacter]|uniref:hypothetical protein n=1 Tax=unclassified Empedobacter TaxID=2643773 RepID=UPI0025B7BE59|nr:MULTISPECIES: hypothetical protein [unclassified Empedobacter]